MACIFTTLTLHLHMLPFRGLCSPTSCHTCHYYSITLCLALVPPRLSYACSLCKQQIYIVFVVIEFTFCLTYDTCFVSMSGELSYNPIRYITNVWFLIKPQKVHWVFIVPSHERCMLLVYIYLLLWNLDEHREFFLNVVSFGTFVACGYMRKHQVHLESFIVVPHKPGFFVAHSCIVC